MDGGRRKDGERHSSSGGRSLRGRNADVKGSKPLSTHPRRGIINSLTSSVDGGPRMNYSSGEGRRTGGRTVAASSSAFPHGISSSGGRTDITAPNLAGSSYKKGGSTDTKTDAAKLHGKAPRSEALPDRTADPVAELKKPQPRQDPGSNRSGVPKKLDLRKTVNIGARDERGWQELLGKSGAEESLLYLKKQMAEIAFSSGRRCEADERRQGEEKVVVERDTAESVAGSVGARVKAADMPSTMQIHAFRCARKAFDSQTTFSSKQLAFALKKEFDRAYGVAWHCIVGTSFGSFVTHSAGGFLYFCIDHVAVLLFKTAVERLESLE